MQRENLCCANNSSAAKYWPFSPICLPCLIGLEACAGAHYWEQELIKSGHDAQSRWINDLVKRSNANIAAVVVANKNARIVFGHC
jgi:hypothetical protein